MRAYIGLTDGAWYSFLRSAPHLPEINFWKPGGHRFRALEQGELFLFKLHSPNNFIVGGGVFVHSSVLPVSLAWESFEEANGAASFEEMRGRIESHRTKQTAPIIDYPIGCVILSQPFFLPESEWIPMPSDWRRGIQQGKSYDLMSGEGALLYARLRSTLSREITGSIGAGWRSEDAPAESERYGTPILVAPRLGQGSFRVIVTDAYDRRCAITGEKVLPVLQAAHIRPFARSGPHRVQNGLLLRSDLHTLFDRGYLTVVPDRRIEVSRRLHEDFDNGRDYYALGGQRLRDPLRPDQTPSAEFLEWHNENVFRG